MPGKPNFLLILADDMGYGDFGCFNYGISRTPTLDQLVRGGLCLTQHYSASPVCAPARASLITGRYPHRTGVLDTLEMRGLDRLALRERTLAELLKPAGYVTGLVGKWHNGALDARYHPNRRGFDEFAGFCGGWAPYWNWRIDRNGSIGSSDGRYLTDVFTEEAADFIRRHRSESFFLYLAYNAPHFPFEAPDDAIKPYRETGSFTAAVSAIYAMIEIMDRGIARLPRVAKHKALFHVGERQGQALHLDAVALQMNGVRPSIQRGKIVLPAGGHTDDDGLHVLGDLQDRLARAALARDARQSPAQGDIQRGGSPQPGARRYLRAGLDVQAAPGLKEHHQLAQ